MRFLLALCASFVTLGGMSCAAFAQVEAVQAEIANAKMAYAEQNYTGAASHYVKALSYADKLPTASKILLWSNLGTAYNQDGNYDAAEQAFKHALAFNVAHGDLAASRLRAGTMRQYAHLLRVVHRRNEADEWESQATAILSRPDMQMVRTSSPPAAGVHSVIASSNPTATSTLLPVLPDEKADADKKDGQEKKDAIPNYTAEQLVQFADEKPDSLQVHMILAYKLCKAEKFELCAKYLEAVAVHSSDSAAVYATLAMCYSRTSNYDQAIASSRRAVQLDPRNEIYLHNLVAAYSAAGKMKAQLETCEQFVARFPNSQYAAGFKLDAERLKKVVEKTAETELSKPTADEIAHSFAKRPMPIRVFITEQDPTWEVPDEQGVNTHKHPQDLVNQALSIWTKRSMNRVSFIASKDPEASDIVFVCANVVEAVEVGTAGVTAYGRPNDGQNLIKALVITKDKKPIKSNEFLSVALHELGHALGLAHSSSADDIMFWQERPHPPTTISNNDQRRIMQLYSN